MALEPVRTQETIRFGEDFELDLHGYELRRAGRVLKLERIPMEVLVFLAEQRGQLVSREQIVGKIWGKDVFLDTDNSINGAIRKIRQVLKDDPEHPRFIQTITGRGYRFIAPVIGTEPEQPVVARVPHPSRSWKGGEAESSTRRWQVVLGITVPLTIALIVALGVYFQRSPSQVRPQASSGRTMLAVLPFENLTGDPGQDYFSDGLTEEMIAQLGNLDPQHLGVIARTSVMRYKHSQEPLDQIGRELGVQYVLEGSVRRDSGKVRITAQLIQTRDQTHLWARQYDRELTSLLALQAEIARETADEIQFTLGNGHKKIIAVPTRQPTLSPNAYEAYDLYLKGRYFWNKRTLQGLQQAIDYFQKAIAKDPGYAPAYAGLADSYLSLGGVLGFLSPRDVLPQAKTAALKALEIDDTLAEAHYSLAETKLKYEWDWLRAEQEYRRAIQLNPNYAQAHNGYGTYLEVLGRFDEAIAERKRAQELDPLSPFRTADVGYPFYYSGQYDRAIEHYRRALELDPNFLWGYLWVGQAYVEKGMHEEAIAEIRKAVALSEGNTRALATLGYAYAVSGRRREALKVLSKLKARSKQSYVSPYFIALVYAGLGESDRTFEWLEKAYQERHPYLVHLKVEPVFGNLRSDSRFQDLLRRIGLLP